MLNIGECRLILANWAKYQAIFCVILQDNCKWAGIFVGNYLLVRRYSMLWANEKKEKMNQNYTCNMKCCKKIFLISTTLEFLTNPAYFSLFFCLLCNSCPICCTFPRPVHQDFQGAVGARGEGGVG